MSDTYVFADAKEDLLRELVKQQQVANVIAALTAPQNLELVPSGFEKPAALFVVQAVVKMVRDGYDDDR